MKINFEYNSFIYLIALVLLAILTPEKADVIKVLTFDVLLFILIILTYIGQEIYNYTNKKEK